MITNKLNDEELYLLSQLSTRLFSCLDDSNDLDKFGQEADALLNVHNFAESLLSPVFYKQNYEAHGMTISIHNNKVFYFCEFCDNLAEEQAVCECGNK